MFTPILYAPSFNRPNKNSAPLGPIGSVIATIFLAAFVVAATWFVVWVCIG